MWGVNKLLSNFHMWNFKAEPKLSKEVRKPLKDFSKLLGKFVGNFRKPLSVAVCKKLKSVVKFQRKLYRGSSMIHLKSVSNNSTFCSTKLFPLGKLSKRFVFRLQSSMRICWLVAAVHQLMLFPLRPMIIPLNKQESIAAFRPQTNQNFSVYRLFDSHS